MDPDYQPQSPRAYDALIQQLMQQIQAALQQGAGADDEYRTRALQSQLQSAKEARANALEIAQLQAKTSRYGTDVASRDRMAQLTENARQYDATHGLDLAEAYTKYSSTPDMLFARADFLDALGRVGQGLMPRPQTSQPMQPQAKTWQDFAALASYNGSTVPGAASGGGGSAGSAGSSPTDPRMTAANAVMKAIPPSETPGADGQDWAALEAIRQLYTAGRPGALERLGPARTKIAQAGLARMGYDPAAMTEDFYRAAPGQKSARLA